MDENKNGGELYGFDSVNDNKGYTVTPEGGFYTDQEPASEPQPEPTPEQKSEPTQAEEPEPPRYNGYTGGQPSQNAVGYTFTAKPEPPHKRKEKGSFSLTTLIISVLVAAIIGGACGIGGSFAYNIMFGASRTPTDVTPPENYTIDVKDVDVTAIEAVAAKVTPSVVGIRTTVAVHDFFYGEQSSSGEGSGVAYTEDGYIITNYHVISEAVENRSESSEIRVFLSYGDDTEGFPATVVGYNISYDLAVIKINVTGLTPVTFADSDKLSVGEFVVAVGNPGGLQFMSSVTYGVVSGLNRNLSDAGIGSKSSLIQTDAAINPGNSGGALVNLRGELVGINSSKLVSESYEGMGFAIPSNATREICDKIIAKEYDPDPYLGITISSYYDAATLKKHGYPVGAVVESVVSGSPADDAGIKRGDIITEFNGTPITDYTMFGDALASAKPGDTVTIKIYRSKRYYNGTVTIGSNNSQ